MNWWFRWFSGLEFLNVRSTSSNPVTPEMLLHTEMDTPDDSVSHEQFNNQRPANDTRSAASKESTKSPDIDGAQVSCNSYSFLHRGLKATQNIDIIFQRLRRQVATFRKAWFPSCRPCSKHNHRLLETSAGQDCVLASLEYLLHVLHYLLIIRRWIKKIIIANFILSKRTRSQISHTKFADDFGSSIPLSLSSMFSETRYTIRLFSLFTIWDQWIDAFQNHRGSLLQKVIGIAQMFTITSYQLLENYAFLGSKQVLPEILTTSPQRRNKCFVWSARSLSLHLSLELVRLWQEALVSENLPSQEMSIDDEKTPGSLVQKNWVWRKRLLSTSVWAVLCFHWGWPPGAQLLHISSGGLSFLADFFSFKDLWEATI